MSKQLSPVEIRWFFPINSITQYKNGVCKVERKSRLNAMHKGDIPRGDRGKIEYLSARARAHLAFTVAATGVEFNSMMTLTYGRIFPHTGKVVKEDLNRMLTWMRGAYNGFSYVWVLEFQRRGAPHIHILTNLYPPSDWARKEWAYNWRKAGDPSRYAHRDWSSREILENQRFVYKVHSHPKAWEAIKHADGATRYITKYCLKVEQKEVPPMFQDVGRFYGWSRDVRETVSAVGSMRVTDDELLVVLEVLNHKTKDWDVIPKYIFGLELHFVDVIENVSRET